MIRYLAYASLLWLLCCLPLTAGAVADDHLLLDSLASDTVLSALPPQPSIEEVVDSNLYEYAIEMDFRGRVVTAMCIVQVNADNDIVGTVLNEFGVKFFDFTYNGKKAKVHNVLPEMNKWYIRYVLRRDFKLFCKHFRDGGSIEQSKCTLEHLPDGTIVLSDNKYKIKYTFTALQQAPI